MRGAPRKANFTTRTTLSQPTYFREHSCRHKHLSFPTKASSQTQLPSPTHLPSRRTFPSCVTLRSRTTLPSLTTLLSKTILTSWPTLPYWTTLMGPNWGRIWNNSMGTVVWWRWVHQHRVQIFRERRWTWSGGNRQLSIPLHSSHLNWWPNWQKTTSK